MKPLLPNSPLKPNSSNKKQLPPPGLSQAEKDEIVERVRKDISGEKRIVPDPATGKVPHTVHVKYCLLASKM